MTANEVRSRSVRRLLSQPGAILVRLGVLAFILAGTGLMMLALASATLAGEAAMSEFGYGYGYGYGDPILLTAESGAAAIELDWNASGDSTIERYNVFRALTGTNELSLVAVVTDTFYFDSDSTLQSGKEYCYQVEEVPMGERSNIACALFGQLELWVPRIRGAMASMTSVPINIRNAYQLRIAAANIWVDFDPRVIQVVSMTRAPLTSQYAWSYSIQSTGVYSRARIAAVNLDPPSLYGEGPLFWLHVRVLGTPDMSTTLDLREYMAVTGGGTSIYVPGDGSGTSLKTVPLRLEDGAFEIGVDYTLGDVDGNSVIDAADAYGALCIVAGRCVPTWPQRFASDANGNSRTDAGDAAMILYHATFGLWPDHGCDGQALHIVLNLSNVRGRPDEMVETVLTAQNLLDWAGGEIVVTYDPELIQEVMSVQAVGLASDFALQWSRTPGRVHVALATAASVSGSDEVLRVRVRLARPDQGVRRGTLALADAALVDSAGRDFATSELQATITREHGEVSVDSQVFVPIAYGE